MTDISARLIEGYRGIVQSWECDILNHLNVSHYFGRASDQAFFLRQALGLSPQKLRTQEHGTVALEEHARFHREIRAGEIFYGRTAPVELDERTMVAFSEFRNGHDKLITSFRTLVGHFDLKSRRLIPWADETHDAFSRHQITLPDYAKPRHIIAASHRTRTSTQAESAAAGFIRTGATAINQWECDHFGHLNTMFYVRRQTEAAPNFWHLIGLPRAKMEKYDTSFVVGEMRINYLAELTAGDIVASWSGLHEYTDKSILMEHRLFNAETETLSSSALVRAVCFDLKTRRATQIPDSIGAHFAPYTIKS